MLDAGTAARGGLKVSPGGLLQNELIKGQIRHRLAKPVVLGLQLLQTLDLIGLEPTVFLAPAIIGEFAHADLANGISDTLALRDQYVDLPQLRDDRFRLMALPRHSGPP